MVRAFSLFDLTVVFRSRTHGCDARVPVRSSPPRSTLRVTRLGEDFADTVCACGDVSPITFFVRRMGRSLSAQDSRTPPGGDVFPGGGRCILAFLGALDHRRALRASTYGCANGVASGDRSGVDCRRRIELKPKPVNCAANSSEALATENVLFQANGFQFVGRKLTHIGLSMTWWQWVLCMIPAVAIGI